MKNTKLNEGLDHSNQQDVTSQSKRKILTSIGVSSGILGASALSNQWTKPVVNSIILPAHAQPSPGMGTTMMDTTMMDTTMMDTTMMDTTPPPMPAIILSPMELGVVNAESVNQIAVRLSTRPTGPVIVTATGDGITLDADDTAEFTTTNWNQDQVIVVTAGNQPDSQADEMEVTVTFKATGANSGYAGVEATLTYTVGFYTDQLPASVSATGGAGRLTVEWTAPETRNPVERYIVQASRTTLGAPVETDVPADDVTVGVGNAAVHSFNAPSSSRSHEFKLTGKPGNYFYRVIVIYTEPSDTSIEGAFGSEAVTVT